jgi:1-acyl-sn-glycerol-3-phosphate acyltransferase
MPNHKFDGWSLDDRNPAVIERWMPVWEWFYRYYFRVHTSGWEHMPTQGRMLVVGSHNGGLIAPDVFMLIYDWFCRYGTDRLAYALMHPQLWKVAPWLSQLSAEVGAVVAHPNMAIAALQREAAVLVYPGGAEDVFKLYSQRHQINLANRKGFIKLALREHTPIIPAVSVGAHETLIVLANIYPQIRRLHEMGVPWLFGLDPTIFPVYLGLPWGIGLGPLPNFPFPAQIHTRICPPITFDRYGRSAALDRDYVDACYLQVEQSMQADLDRLVIETGKAKTEFHH